MVPPLVELALNYYRNPLDYGHLADVAQPLPSGFPGLVADFGAALSSAHIEETAEQLSTNPEELQAAARFFARHALLNPAADHYRCLGLNRRSTNEQIRANYQILIRMFHPDRMSEADEVDLAYSSRLNAAYRVLREPESRAQYDQRLPRRQIGTRRRDASRYFQANPKTMAAARTTSRSGRYWAARKSAARIAVLALALALLGVSAAWLNRERQPATLRLTQPASEVTQQQPLPLYLKGVGANATSHGQTTSPQAHQQTEMRATSARPKSDPLGKPFSGRAESLADHQHSAKPLSPATASGQPVRDRHSATTLKPTQLSTAVIKESTAGHGSMTETDDRALMMRDQQPLAADGLQPHPSLEERIEAIRESAIAETKRPPSEPETEPTAKSPLSSTQLAAEPQPQGRKAPSRPNRQPTPRSQAPMPAEHDITAGHAEVIGARMLRELEASYRRGDAEAFAALFTNDARTTDGNGRTRIRQLYQDLFRKSIEQSMTVKRIRWSVAPDGVISGRGQVSVAVKNRRTGWNRTDGALRLDLNQVDGDYRITAMFYDTDNAPGKPTPPPASVRSQSKPTQTQQPEIVSKSPAEAEPAPLIGAKLVALLESAYQSGNASAFASLFTSNARTTDGNGRTRIRQIYGDLFRKSLEQSMSIRGIRWNRTSSGEISGHGRVSVSVKKPLSGWSRHSGNIQLTLDKVAGDYRVAAMYYDLN
jgi:hypothetical protein